MPVPIWPAPMMPTVAMVTGARDTFPPEARVERPTGSFMDVPSTNRASLSERLGHFWDRLEKVSHQAVVGDLEDRRFRVLVDGDDHLGVLPAGEWLARTRNADGNVKFRRDDLAGLTDLVVVRHEAGVDGGAAGADTGAPLVGQRLDDLEVFAGAHAAAAGNDDLGGGEFGALGLRQRG